MHDHKKTDRGPFYIISFAYIYVNDNIVITLHRVIASITILHFFFIC